MVVIFRSEELGEAPSMDQIQLIARSNFVFVLDLETGQFAPMKDRSGDLEAGYLEDFPIALGDALTFEENMDKEDNIIIKAD